MHVRCATPGENRGVSGDEGSSLSQPFPEEGAAVARVSMRGQHVPRGRAVEWGTLCHLSLQRGCLASCCWNTRDPRRTTSGGVRLGECGGGSGIL